jgi:hypothetical protein
MPSAPTRTFTTGPGASTFLGRIGTGTSIEPGIIRRAFGSRFLVHEVADFPNMENYVSRRVPKCFADSPFVPPALLHFLPWLFLKAYS